MSTSPKTPAEALAEVTTMLGCVLGTEQDVRRIRDALAMLRRHLEPQPMETAPKDGTRVMLWDTEWLVGSCSPHGNWRDDEDFRVIPTHWLPLPAPANQENDHA